MLKSLQFFLIKDISKFALCATKTESLQNSINLGNTLSIVSAFLTSSFVILVSSVILYGILISGLMNVLKESIILPFFILTAPISMILSYSLENPVVSKSKTTKVLFIVCPLTLVTIGTPSFTRYASTP